MDATFSREFGAVIPDEAKRRFLITTPECTHGNYIFTNPLLDPPHNLNFLPSSFADPAETNPAGLRLAKTIQNSIFTPEFRRRIIEYSIGLEQHCQHLEPQSAARLFPLETVHVYCAPCPVAVNTAVAICRMNTTPEIEYLVRVDPRIGATCCGNEDGAKRLTAVQAVIDNVKMAEWTLPSTLTSEERKRYALVIKSFDRVWIEKTLFKATELWGTMNNWNWVLNPPASEYLDYIHGERFAVFLTEPSYAMLVYDDFRLVHPEVGELYESKKMNHDMHFLYTGTCVWRDFDPN